jgi:hypothetical protein
MPSVQMPSVPIYAGPTALDALTIQGVALGWSIARLWRSQKFVLHPPKNGYSAILSTAAAILSVSRTIVG